MFTERFSPGVSQQEREQRGADMDVLARQEVGLAADLRAAGKGDQAAMADLFALASSTAEVRRGQVVPERIDRGVLTRALEGQL